MSYGVFFKNDLTERSRDYPGKFETIEAANEAIKIGQKQGKGPRSFYDIVELSEVAKFNRNRRQRAKRNSLEAKAKEARASRKSYYKAQLRKESLSGPVYGCDCKLCTKARELGL